MEEKMDIVWTGEQSSRRLRVRVEHKVNTQQQQQSATKRILFFFVDWTGEDGKEWVLVWEQQEKGSKSAMWTRHLAWERDIQLFIYVINITLKTHSLSASSHRTHLRNGKMEMASHTKAGITYSIHSTFENMQQQNSQMIPRIDDAKQGRSFFEDSFISCLFSVRCTAVSCNEKREKKILGDLHGTICASICWLNEYAWSIS